MRFITEDTNKGDVKDPLSLNLYTYCQGNPIMYVDLDGHAPTIAQKVNETIYAISLYVYTWLDSRNTYYWNKIFGKLLEFFKIGGTKGAAEAAGSAGNKTLLSGSEWNKYFQETYGARNVKWMPQSFEHMIENPQTLYGCTQSEVAKILGDGWTASPYGNSGTGWKFINNAHPDLMVFQHNADGVHGGAYYGFSTGATGTVKLVGNDYKPLAGDKAIIINMGH